MGQYYIVVNVDKKEYLDPLKFNDGLKLLEITGGHSFTLSALALLLADGNGRGGGDFPCSSSSVPDVNEWIGRWSGDRIVIAGDYADDCKFLSAEDISQFYLSHPEALELIKRYRRKGPNLYEVARRTFRDISEHMLAVMLQEHYMRQDLLEDLAYLLCINGGPHALKESSNKFVRALLKAFEISGEQFDLFEFASKALAPQNTQMF